MTIEEYLAFERGSELRHEFHDGEVVAVTGGTLNHSQVISNLVACLASALQSTTSRVLSQSMRVRIPNSRRYVYPDAVVVVDEPKLEDEQHDTLLNPSTIIEVLSSSTEAYDRGEKFGYVRRIPSLQEYILVSQDRPRVERFALNATTGQWVVEDAVEGIEQSVRLSSLNITLPLRDIYRQVRFED